MKCGVRARESTLPMSKRKHYASRVCARGAPRAKYFAHLHPQHHNGERKERVLCRHGCQPAILDAFPSIFEKQPLGAGPWRRIVITL